MNTALVEESLVLYDYVQVLVAFAAVLLAIRWKKYEFLAGLACLFLYSVVEIVEVVFFTLLHSTYFDIARFGFILLAIVFFVLGMHPTVAPRTGSFSGQRKTEELPPKTESLMSVLRKL